MGRPYRKKEMKSLSDANDQAATLPAFSRNSKPSYPTLLHRPLSIKIFDKV